MCGMLDFVNYYNRYGDCRLDVLMFIIHTLFRCVVLHAPYSHTSARNTHQRLDAHACPANILLGIPLEPQTRIRAPESPPMQIGRLAQQLFLRTPDARHIRYR